MSMMHVCSNNCTRIETVRMNEPEAASQCQDLSDPDKRPSQSQVDRFEFDVCVLASSRSAANLALAVQRTREMYSDEKRKVVSRPRV